MVWLAMSCALFVTLIYMGKELHNEIQMYRILITERKKIMKECKCLLRDTSL